MKIQKFKLLSIKINSEQYSKFNLIVSLNFYSFSSKKYNKQTEVYSKSQVSKLNQIQPKVNKKDKSLVIKQEFIEFFGNEMQNKNTFNKDYIPICVDRKKFNKQGKLLIAKGDTKQKILVLFLLSFFLAISYMFYRLYIKTSKKYENINSNISNIIVYLKKGIYIALSLFSLLCFILFLKNVNMFIRKIYIFDNGKSVEIVGYFSKNIVDIENFKIIKPDDETIFTKEEYIANSGEGFPIIVNNKIYLISKMSIVYEKEILKEVSMRRYIDVI